jgi:hypothetical protein
VPHRYYTPELANRALPLVARIVADVKSTADLLARVIESHQRSERPRDAAWQDELDSQVEPLAVRWRALFAELSELGVELKDARTGLIDFRARRRGADVYLCWRLGEASVLFWHPLETGLPGREPISTF